MKKLHRDVISPVGFRRLQLEYDDLKHKERPELVKVIAWAAGNGDRSENGDYIYGKKRLYAIDKRLRFLSERLSKAEVIDPVQNRSSKVGFGATVKIVDEDDNERSFTIVGIEEVEPSKGFISWQSPLGNALLHASVGDWVTYQSPQGKKEVEILSISYNEFS